MHDMVRLRSVTTDGSAQLARFLYRPIVFREPDRLVDPPSWLEHIPFAFWIVDALRPATFVELGTQSGNSYAAFAQAVQMLELPTTAYAVDTWRGDLQAGLYGESVFREWAAYHDRHFAAFSRLIRSTFADAVQHFADGSIDLLHLDGCHTYEAASADFELWRPKLGRRGVILIHDINVRERDFGTWRLWDELEPRFPSFKFLHGHGLGVLAVGPEVPEALQELFSLAHSEGDVRDIRQFFARLGGAISARFAAREAERCFGPEAANVADLDRQLGLLREQLGDEQGRRRRLEMEREGQDATNSRLTAQAVQDAAQIDLLARQARATEEALRRKTQLLAALRERRRDESVQRRRAEGEIDRLRAVPQSSFPALQDQFRRVKAWSRKRLRYLRTAARASAALGLLPTGRRLPSGSVVTFLTNSARLREAYGLFVSGLFDEAYYRRRYPDVSASRLTPLAHFVLKGAGEGRSPHPLFDGAYYLKCNPDVASDIVNPLAHYRACGAFEGRSPHPLFDVDYYLNTNPDVRDARVEPLGHFLRFGATDSRDPNPFFDCSYYVQHYPDVVQSGMNPLMHFMFHGWREGRRPSAAFDTEYYLAQNADVRLAGENPLAHYLMFGRFEGRMAKAAGEDEEGAEIVGPEEDFESPPIELKVKSLTPAQRWIPTVLCLSHVMPFPPRAGNEYRIHRMLCWLRDQGYRIIPVIAPLPGEDVDSSALHALAGEFSNAVLCNRDGRVEYILRDVPDVLASLDGEPARPVSLLLDEDIVRGSHERQMVQMDRVFCHDAVVTTALRLHQGLGSYVLLAEYIWMSRVLPLISGDVLKVIDTIDVFSTKREKVLQFGIDDLHVDAREEAKRLRLADLILAIQDEELQELRQLVPGQQVVTAGVDFDVVDDPGTPQGRRVLYVASGNQMNRKGLLDFLRFAWPLIRREVPDAELLLAGRVSDAPEADLPGVIRLGPVEDLTPLYSQARVVINPAVAGTGLKIKTLEALGHLRPIVTWPSGSEGFAPELAALCVTARDWFEFSRRVADLLAADEPRLFTRVERDTIVRLTSPATVYRDMTEAIVSLREERIGFETAGSGLRV
jgi:hypothetical protein